MATAARRCEAVGGGVKWGEEVEWSGVGGGIRGINPHMKEQLNQALSPLS